MSHRVIIASKNPVKIEAVSNAFTKMFHEHLYTFESIEVESGVANQPFSNNETLKGAITRAKNAKASEPEANYWVGIEGGVEKKEEGLSAFAWVVVFSKNQSGKAKSATFFLPNKIAKLVEEGVELGEADDIVFNKVNSKQENGAVGILTDNVMDRTSYYTDAVVLALIPFRHPELY